MLSSSLRTFWVNGLNEITGNNEHRFAEFIISAKLYVIYNPITQDHFTLNFHDKNKTLQHLAADIIRFGCASHESINDIYYKKAFPNSHAWKLIKCYYAAYYAAHSILRMFGISCTNFETTHVKKIESIANNYSNQNGIAISKGYYQCTFNSISRTIDCKKISVNGNKGSHEQLWQVFLTKVDTIIEQLTNNSSTIVQPTIAKLFDLKENLTYMGCNGGNWLSTIRNKINYKQEDGIWYPYKNANKSLDTIDRIIKTWAKNPMDIDISSHTSREYMRFVSTCIFLISLNKEMSLDMANRCSKGSSFHKNGIIGLLNYIKK